MRKTLEELVYYSIHHHNILPIISACNMDCVFCSHQFNPPQLEVYSLPSRSLEAIRELLDFLDPEKKIVIGESVTRIIEGEPFLHPDFLEILQLIRKQFPETTIQVTTNGSLLTEEKVKDLAKLLSLEINLSLNSATVAGRETLMKDKKPQVSLASAAFLKKYQIPFHGSIVAMPMLVGWEDLRQTIFYLEQQGAQTIRVFLPGYTKYHQPTWKFSLSLWEDLKDFLERIKEEVVTPVTLEPFLVDNLVAEVVGVIKNSSACQAGFKRADQILQVNGTRIKSRVHSFQLIQAAKDPRILFWRKGKALETIIQKKAGQSSGLVFAYDLDPAVLTEWQDAIRRNQAQQVLLLTSVLGEKVIKAALPLLGTQDTQWQVEVVENKFLGGSIISAGLLTVADFREFLGKFFRENPIKPDLILIPDRSFDSWGRDLLGNSYLELAEELAIKIELIFS